MKKRNLVLITVMVAAIALLTFTVTAASNVQYEGYKSFKELLKHEESYKNATIDGTISVTDNGKAIAEIQTKIKLDEESDKTSAAFNVNINGIQRAGQVFGNKDTVIMVDTQNDLYYQAEKTGEWNEDAYNHYDKYESHNMTSKEEALLDHIVGAYKEEFELVSNSDGTKKIIFDLDEDEIPVVLNLMTAAAASENRKAEQYHEYDAYERDFVEKMQSLPFFKGLENPKEMMPQLVDEIKIKGLELAVSVDQDNKIAAISFIYSIAGVDEAGVHHDIVVHSNFQTSDIDTTVVDSIDLAGKTVETIEFPEHRR